MPGLGLYFANQNRTSSDDVDFFSSSQPITAKTDHVLATSPISSRANLATSPLAMTKKALEPMSAGQPSSPERKYKMLFHPPPQADKPNVLQ
jgi:TAG lipase/steryl ester hydrolase/phospholipase A2/LPA acyltransferase